MKNAIEMKHLTKTYGKNRGITDINLCVEEGDIFGYLGPNGAGKSTSIRCLLGMIGQTSGEAYVLNKAVGKEQVSILKEIGYMPSETMFYPSMKAGEVIAYAAAVRGLNCKSEADKLCDALEVDKNKKISELSLGNRKKISIVCAMQHKPKLLIFDEPTSGLDPLMQEVFFELIREQNRGGTTCFLSSHVLPEVKKYCQHVGIIREGKLVTVDSVEHLLSSSLRKGKITWKDGQKAELPQLEGLLLQEQSDKSVIFNYSGEMGKLLSALHTLPIGDFLLEEPSLEEVFMHFYEKE